MQHEQTAEPLTLFYSYAHEDEWLREQLEKHLHLLSRQGLLSEWHDRQIIAGTVWAQEMDAHLETASMILLLVSSDFLSSDYCYNIEMQRALERHKRGEACVIPIILRPCDWHNAPFSHVQVLPRDGKPVTEWANLDTAFLDITQGIRRAIKRQTSPVRPLLPLSSVDRQYRLRLLKRVRQTWIEGRLEQSLHQTALIALDLQERPDALDDPWYLEAQETNRPPRPLPAGTPIVQVYGEADGELLILGEPGAGKTTLLLELARTLLERSEQEEQERIPVVFNLSSWAQRRQPLAVWLVEELWAKYRIPLKVGQAWIASGQILPLLDGLDEVTEDARPACAQAINTYHQDCMERGPAPLVVCCRSQEYLTLSTRVTLQQAVSIQPLTDEQIERYLQSAGDQLEGLRQALRTNRELYQLAQRPLMLSIFTLAYQGVAPEDIPTEGTQEALQRQAFAAYVLTHRGVSKHASHEQMLQWLTFLATRMKQKQQMTFYLEHLQPDWQVGWWRHLFYRLSIGLFVWLVSMLAVGPSLVLTPDLSAGGLGLGLGLGLFISLHRRIQPQEILTWSWKEAKRNVVVLVGILVAALLALLIGGLLALLISGLIGDLVAGLIIGLASILVGSLISRLIGRLPTKQIDDCMRFTPNQGIWLSGRSGLVMGLIGGLSFWLLDLLVLAPSSMAIDVVDALLAFLPIGLLVGLMCGMDAFFQHFTLRFWLWRTDQLPWNLVSFLDEATNHLLLHKIGGGYIFIHRLLLDYFADLEKKEP